MKHHSAKRPAKTYSQKGDEFASRGRMRDAEKFYRKALRDQPSDAATLGKLGNTLACQNKLLEAITCYDKSLGLAPENVSLITNMAILLKQARRLQDAINCFNKALDLQPDHANTLFHLAELYLLIDKIDLSNSFFQKAVTSYKRLQLSNHTLKTDDAIKLGSAYFRLKQFKEARNVFSTAAKADPHHALLQIKMGAALSSLGKTEEAIFCFQQAINLKPANIDARRELGFQLLKLEQHQAAAKHLTKVVEKRPGDSSANHFLAAAQKLSPSTSTPDYIEDLFNQYAESFDNHLVGALGYRLPWILREAIGHITGKITAQWSIMDLGCGTGLCGPLFRDLAEKLIGVDLSNKMLAQARQLQVYDELIKKDASTALSAKTNQLDLIISTDVFIYIGDLKPVFIAAQKALVKNGLFAFTTEATELKDFQLQSSGRYGHNETYISKLAQNHGFKILEVKPVIARYEKLKPVTNNLFILCLKHK